MSSIKLHNDRIQLYHGDCLGVMPTLPAQNIDMVLADLPYGTTRNKWDSIIPLDTLWNNYKRIRKPNAAIVLTAQTPFDKVLGVSNLEELRYEWIWNKTNPSGHLNANKMPMKDHENVLVFYSSLPVYNRQMVPLNKPLTVKRSNGRKSTNNYNNFTDSPETTYNEVNPRTVIVFESERGKHPTQKPVALMEYLIKTYTNGGDLVLDNTMGSGTTGEAAAHFCQKYQTAVYCTLVEQDPIHAQTCYDRTLYGCETSKISARNIQTFF